MPPGAFRQHLRKAAPRHRGVVDATCITVQYSTVYVLLYSTKVDSLQYSTVYALLYSTTVDALQYSTVYVLLYSTTVDALQYSTVYVLLYSTTVYALQYSTVYVLLYSTTVDTLQYSTVYVLLYSSTVYALQYSTVYVLLYSTTVYATCTTDTRHRGVLLSITACEGRRVCTSLAGDGLSAGRRVRTSSSGDTPDTPSHACPHVVKPSTAGHAACPQAQGMEKKGVAASKHTS
jgi:hypothetical protein